MWLILAFCSAVLLGFYDTSKKAALRGNDVLPVLLLNTLFTTLIFSPVIIRTLSDGGLGAHEHMLIMLKSVIVLTSWIFGYIGLKHLPITIVGPINATRPVLVLIGATLVFGERLNLWQWAGVILAALSLFLLSLSSRKEKISFVHNRWIWCVAAAAVTGAVSGLYDKFIMKRLEAATVQGWYNFYQLLLMGAICLILRYIPMWRKRRAGEVVENGFRWSWAIPLISIFISAADWCYLSALEQDGSMISVVSLIRRSSVIISFICGILIFKERNNVKAKVFDLSLVLLGMFFIWLGSH